jgi:hypothetical protein
MTSPTRTRPTTSSSNLEKQILDAEDSPKILPAIEHDIAQFGPAPDGGTRAWLNAAAGFCVFFGCLGFTSCFGVLQEYYSTHQLRDRSPSEISWIGSLSSFIQFAGGAIGGPMFDRYGVKVSKLHTFLTKYKVNSQNGRSSAPPQLHTFSV